MSAWFVVPEFLTHKGFLDIPSIEKCLGCLHFDVLTPSRSGIFDLTAFRFPLLPL